MIPITDMLIHRITLLSQVGENPTIEFGGKIGECELAKAMKDKFKFTKKSRGYSTSIANPAINVVTKILAGKIMSKCHTNEVLTPVMSLAA